MAKDRVLLVDDEVNFLEALAERMRMRGLEVTCAKSGREALTAVEEATFDAVVLDLAMPGLDGLETLRRLRQMQPELQVMILSGRATVQTAVEATRLGATDIFEKPTEVDTLVQRIRSARAARLAHDDEVSQEHIDEIMRTKGW
ncbi:MAG TPA: response regulator [Chondromyces sp.]|nr:response regulator [Chondromyces sp.]